MVKNTRDFSNSLDAVSFYCKHCKNKFVCAPETVVDLPDCEYHPWDYHATCSECGEQANQAGWERGVMSMVGKHTGPTTPEGKARSQQNIIGAMTPEQGQRNRFNALKHGMYAQTVEFFPARPGQYVQCTTCTIDHDTCRSNTVCAREADRAMKFHLAFRDGDPTQLRDMQAGLQARIQSIIDSIMLTIIQTGVEIKAPAWYHDAKGKFHLAEYVDGDGSKQLIQEIRAHPLLKVLSEFISRNNLTMADMAMTPKMQDQQDAIQGNLQKVENRSDELLAYQKRQADALEGLKGMIQESQKRTASDPILIEHGGDNV